MTIALIIGTLIVMEFIISLFIVKKRPIKHILLNIVFVAAFVYLGYILLN
jgi:hypothetical protein